jgi:biotin carboxyl carrier protein
MLTVEELHSFNGHPAQFWPTLLTFSCQLAGAEHGFLLSKTDDCWDKLLSWPEAQRALTREPPSPALILLADSCHKNGQALLTDNADKERFCLAIALQVPPGDMAKILILQLQKTNRHQVECALQQLRMLADAPIIFHQRQQQQQEQKKAQELAEVLDLLLVLNQQQHFTGATMQIVNDVTTRFHCSRVNLGWLHDGYIRLQAVSHMEKFEAKMAVVNELEAAMEETLDQDEEILVPTTDSHAPVHRDHDTYATAQKVPQLLSLPLRSGGQPLGVLFCEKNRAAFNENEIRRLRILCDQITPRLVMLKEAERGFVARLRDQVTSLSKGFLGGERTLTKLLGVVVAGLLLAAVIIELPYRIEAPFILRSKDVRQISAPFSSYVDQVYVEIGQQVEAGQPLLSLDNSDLLLEESEALATQVRYQREVEKARAQNALIEMKIAQAQANQALARLELIQHRLSRTQLRAPINGILVEGDFSEQRGRPVEKGEILCTVAQHERLYAQIKISESDMQDIAPNLSGELVFISRPQQKFPFTLAQVDPLASSDEAGNLFIARSQLFTSRPDWWRPGMSGIAKIDIGPRRLLWIVSHRTVSFFRLLIWW